MARRARVSDKPLKDVNNDGKRNLGDTWFGDLIGLDGKLGVQGPSFRESSKGARRVMDGSYSSGGGSTARAERREEIRRERAAAEEASRPRGAPVPEVTVTPLSDIVGGRGDGMAEARRRRDDMLIRRAEEAIRRAENPPTVMGYTWEQYKEGNGLGRLRAGLPANMTRSEFLKRAEEEKRSTLAAPAAPSPYLETPGNVDEFSGMAKGGLVKKRKVTKKKPAAAGKTRSGHTDMRKGGLFK